MLRTFIGKAGGIAALTGFVFLGIMAAFGYSFVSAFRADDEALSTYAEELILAQSLEEAVQRKLANGHAYLLAHDDRSRRAFEQADSDVQYSVKMLQGRVTSAEGVRLLGTMIRGIHAHDRALRRAMDARGTVDGIARLWTADVLPLAVTLRQDIEAFSSYKRALYDRAKETAFRVQRRALFVTGSTALVGLLGGLFGGAHLFRSARRSFVVEARARAAAERERAFFTALLDQLPIGVIAAEAPSGRILVTTGWARRLLRTAPRDGPEPGFSSLPFYRLDGSGCPIDQTPLARALRGEVVQNEELRTEGGRVYAMTAGPICDQAGTRIAAVAGFTDVTARKEAEKERELFIGALGHDLRNPLTAISLAAGKLTQRPDLPEAAIKPAARIASSAQRMQRLIGELLDFAKSQHGTLPINPQAFRLSDVASEITAEFKLAHPEREIHVRPEGNCGGYWDRGRLAQVFQNLVGNAVQHGAPGQPIEIRTGRAAERVWAKVTNRGAIIPTDEQCRIFEPFRTSKGSTGLGLGLYIARAIVEAHGGTISVESNADQTTFTIELPPDARPVS
jgi:signal transduction histidine kinase